MSSKATKRSAGSKRSASRKSSSKRSAKASASKKKKAGSSKRSAKASAKSSRKGSRKSKGSRSSKKKKAAKASTDEEDAGEGSGKASKASRKRKSTAGKKKAGSSKKSAKSSKGSTKKSKKSAKKASKKAASSDDDDEEVGFQPDTTFDATPARLGKDKRWKSVVWLRAEEFLRNGPIAVFQDEITPADIEQGALGDCYFLSALAGLAEKPERIENLFITKEPKSNGRYTVRLCSNGHFVEVEVDDRFPCVDAARGPAFSRTKGSELWVMILEKAYAKLHGSYKAIAAGDPGEAMTDLTGAPCERINIDSIPKDGDLFKLLKAWDDAGYVFGCSIPETAGEDHAAMGLIPGHSYTILQVRKAGGEQLLQIRNPWGETEWNGAWGDKSKKWTDALKEELNWTDADDGTFYMNLQDFRKYFVGLQVLYMHDGWNHNVLDLEFEQGFAQMTELTVNEDTEIVLGVVQPDARDARGTENAGYLAVQFKLVERNPYKEVAVSAYARDRQVYIGADAHNPLRLKKGKYVVLSQCDNVNALKKAALTTYSDKPVGLKPFKSNEDVVRYFAAGFKASTRKYGKVSDYARAGGARIYKKTWKFSDGVCILIRNREANRMLQENFSFKLENMAVYGLEEGETSVSVSVPPGAEEFIVVMKTGTLGFSYGSQSAFSIRDVSSISVSDGSLSD